MKTQASQIVVALVFGFSSAFSFLVTAGRAPSDVNAGSQDVKLEDILRTNSYALALSNGNLSGNGLDFLLRATAHTQFFAIAEPHNSKEVPQITSLLFGLLRKQHGFKYLALEQDPVMARMVSAQPIVGKREQIISLAQQYPNGFTFITDQELEMISQVSSDSDGKGDRIWGLDQVFGAIHVLERLSKFASNTGVRNDTMKLIEMLKRNEAERTRKLQRYTLADVGELAEFDQLLQRYQPAAGSEAEFLISQMLLSARVYRNNIAAEKGQLTGYDANLEREENMKALFMIEYRKAQKAGEPLPKVLLKLGHYHLIRGRSWSDILSLGNFIAEFAKSNGMDSFHLAVYNNNASGNYGVLGSSPDYKPLAEAVEKDKWTIVDLRPLREYAYAEKLVGLNPELRRVIYGFDAALLIGGGSPGTYRFMGAH